MQFQSSITLSLLKSTKMSVGPEHNNGKTPHGTLQSVTMQIQKAVSITANPLLIWMVCSKCVEIHTFWEARSKLEMQELPNHQETQRSKAFPSYMWQKNKPTGVLWMNTKHPKEWKWILPLWAPYIQLPKYWPQKPQVPV